MNLFCVSLEGSTDSLYEPVPERQVDQGSSPGTNESRQAHHDFFNEVSNFENEKPKEGKSCWRFSPENKILGKTMNDTIWHEHSKAEKESSIRRPCQLKDLNKDDFLWRTKSTHALQRDRPQGTSFQVIKAGGDPVGSMGTLKRLQKLMWTKKARVQSLDELKPPLINLQDGDDDTFISCMKSTKFQEKKVNHMITRKMEEADLRLASLSMSRDRSSILGGWNLEDKLSPYEGEVPMWKNWMSFPENELWPCADFQIAQVGSWDNFCSCTQHSILKSSHTDTDLLHSWRSSSFGNFDRFRNNSMSKPDDSTEVHEGEQTNENEEQNKTLSSGGNIGKKMRAISWTMKKKVGKKYIKALSEEKDEENGQDALPYRNSDPVIGTHTENVFLKASDSMDSLYSGQSSSSGITSCSDGTSNRDSFRLDDDSPYSGPFCGRAKVHTDFTPSPYDTDSLKIKKGDIIDIICKAPMGMWTGMLNNKVGNFKFIYVDVISEEETAPKKIKAHRSSQREKPKSLKEFLERIHLQEYTSTLLLNGYETLEDLKDIKDSHLIELNIANPEDRIRLLSAAENALEEESSEEAAPVSLSPDILSKSQLDDCPRDSGCYILSGNSDNGKEDLEADNLPKMVQKMTITEPSD